MQALTVFRPSHAERGAAPGPMHATYAVASQLASAMDPGSLLAQRPESVL